MRSTGALRPSRSQMPASADRPLAGFRLPRIRVAERWWQPLAGQLVMAGCLLALVLALAPHGVPAVRVDRAAQVWSYQRDGLHANGRGALAAQSRTAMRTSAWLARAAIERQRDVARLNLLGVLAGEPTANTVVRWRAAHTRLVFGGTLLATAVLLAYRLLGRPRTMAWLVTLLLVAGVTVLLTHPRASVRLAQAATVPDVVATNLSRAGGGRVDVEVDNRTLRVLADRYWAAYVTRPDARLAASGGALDGARRVTVATLALVYVLPSATLLLVAAMAASCAQALLLMLLLAGPLVLPLTLAPRCRAPVTRWWLTPLAGAVLLAAAAVLLSLLVLWLAALLQAADQAAGGLLVPLGLLLAAGRWLAGLTSAAGDHRAGGGAR